MNTFSIDSRGMVEQLAAELERRILMGDLSPGTPLRESRLAEDLGLSRNTVREALRSLAPGGLVRHSPRRGFFVSQLSEDQVRDLYRAREVLELAAVAEPIEVLRDLIPEFESAVTLFDPDDALTGFDADHHFHTTLVSALGSDKLMAVFESLLGELRLVMTSTDLRMGASTQWLEEHEPMIEMIRTGDQPALARELREHLRWHEDSVCTAISAGPVS